MFNMNYNEIFDKKEENKEEIINKIELNEK